MSISVLRLGIIKLGSKDIHSLQEPVPRGYEHFHMGFI